MPQYKHRRDTLASLTNSRFVPAAGYTVTAYDVGGQVETASSGNTIALRSGHGFAADDKFIVKTHATGSLDATTVRSVSSVSGDTLTLKDSAVLTVAVGDILVNLGTDTGGAPPSYNGSTVSIYTNMEGSTAVTNSRVTADSEGSYEYWTADRCWELVRDTNGDPVDVIVDATLGSPKLATGITASTTQSLGEQPLTSEVNFVSTVATASDAVTLPNPADFDRVIIVNDGTETLQIFPHSTSVSINGADGGNSTTLATNSTMTLYSESSTSWRVLN